MLPGPSPCYRLKSPHRHHLSIICTTFVPQGLGFAEGDCGPQSAGLQLSAGDMVKVDLDTEVLKLMQADHGGWNDGMTMVRHIIVPLWKMYSNKG